MVRGSGGTTVLTVTLRERGSDRLVREVSALRAAFREARRARPFTPEAAVAPPDRPHLVMRLPAEEAGCSVRIGHGKAAFARALPEAGAGFASRRGKGERGAWQRRLREHAVRDEDDRARRLRYRRMNPVKHGLVERSTDRLWSSAHRDAAGWDGR